MKKLVFFILAISIHIVANATDSFSTLEERMSGKEFMDTGLSKLSEQELANLNEWVRRHSVATLENAQARPAASASVTYGATNNEDMRGLEHQRHGPKGDSIHSNIVGSFKGWRGTQTLFTLANGMIWQQVEGDTFTVKQVDNPAVTIKKNLLGAWRLSMDGYNNTVRVKRIQ